MTTGRAYGVPGFGIVPSRASVHIRWRVRTVRDSSLTMPDYIDFALDFLIAQTGITQPFAHRRLNCVENTLTALVRQWRPRVPLVPDREIRMSDETRERCWVGSRRRSRAEVTRSNASQSTL